MTKVRHAHAASHSPAGAAALRSLLVPPWPASRPTSRRRSSREAAAASTERAERLPERMMSAIAVVETGRTDAASGTLRPWPWTINADGQGFFFAGKQQAIEAVRALQARGVRSIDVGCMQVNLMFHPNAFASLDQAFDPSANALFAAHFLTALRATHRDWPAAIAAYHSEIPALGAAYQQLCARALGPSRNDRRRCALCRLSRLARRVIAISCRSARSTAPSPTRSTRCPPPPLCTCVTARLRDVPDRRDARPR